MSRREVRETYDRIAEHFAQTRAYAWPAVERFIDDSPSGTVGLDLGCGNGRHAELLADRVDTVLGIDLSRAILETARERVGEQSADLVQSDASCLPVRSECIDLAVYIAAVHHLPSRELRLESLDELARVLTPSGRALVSAWSTEHGKFDAAEGSPSRKWTDGFDTTVEWTLPDGTIVDRFYHIYDPEEFNREVRESDLTAQELFVDAGNCYAIVG